MRPPLRPLLLACVSSALCLAALPPGAAAPVPTSGERADADADELPHGWLARFSGPQRVRMDVVPSASFALPEGEALHPATEVVELGVSYRTSLKPPRPGRYRFGVEAQGLEALVRAKVGDVNESVRLNGSSEAWTDWMELGSEPVELTVDYVRSASVATLGRAMWEMAREDGKGFQPEPIPSSVVSIAPRDRDAARSARAALRGRVLLERKGCTNCHAPAAAAGAVGVRKGPKLDAVAARASRAWTLRWITGPAEVRAGADMPALPMASSIEVARDIALWLESLHVPAAPAPVASEAHVLRMGRDLYHQLGCVACHGALATPAEVLDDDYLPDEVPAVAVARPFGDLEGKWEPAALAAFLKDPRASHPDGRMPSLELSDEEADLLAHYLCDALGARTASDVALDDPEAPERGRKYFAALGCAACHEAGGVEMPVKAPQLTALDAGRGCLDPNDARAPRYDLGEDERAQLRAALEGLDLVSGAAAPLDRMRRDMELLNCRACHALDGLGGPPEELSIYFQAADDRADLGDESRLAPELSGVGFKLTTPWLREVLVDAGRARPYLAMRMPQFGEQHVGQLAELLARDEGVWPNGDADAPAVSDAMVLTGRGLMGLDAMACVSCHSFGDVPPVGSPGVDMTTFTARLRYEWWRAYMQAPARYKPGTRMPAFASGGVSSFDNVLGGDFFAQADAMWAYFSLGKAMPPPKGMELASDMELAVGERPRVVRCFLKEAGSRGIAVGSPVGVHYAFDAQACRLVDAWSGAFLDASGAWAGRGGTVAGGQGERVWTAPAGMPLAFEQPGESWPEATGSEAGAEFLGYRLEEDGSPTFRYRLDGRLVEERCEPFVAPETRVKRTFHVEGLAEGDAVWVCTGMKNGADVNAMSAASVKGQLAAEGSRFEITKRGDGPLEIVLEVKP